MIELRCHRLSFINRWWNAAGVFSLVQLFDHKRFEHSAFKRCEPCSTGEQVANRLCVERQLKPTRKVLLIVAEQLW